MRYESKSMFRSGSVFSTARDSYDLSAIRFLHSGVDTVKQLFNCVIKDSVIAFCENSSSGLVSLGGIDWFFTRSGKTSGYQYIFKNLDQGFVVLLKSFYAEADKKASHLKIEVTPELIRSCSPSSLDTMIMNVAKLFCSELEYSGIAAHLCVDFKGFEVPPDFEARLVTHARRNYKYNNISNVEYTLQDAAVIYGSSQSFTFGSAGSLQMCLYDKTAQASKVDKLTFWQSVWSETPSVEDPFFSEYQNDDVVHRLEFRFHHSVISEFCNGTFIDQDNTIKIQNFSQLSLHLTALFRYALNNYRLQHSSVYIDPFWQLLFEDVCIYALPPDLLYKRLKKKPGESSKRNVAYWLGNLIKLNSRIGIKPSVVTDYILDSGLVNELSDYFYLPYSNRDLLRVVLLEFVTDKMLRHSLAGVAA